MKYLEKLIPAEDKLKHFYLGALAFAFFTLFFDNLTNVCIVFLGAWAWELYQRHQGGTNSIYEILKDVFFGVLLGVIINIVNLF